MMNFLSSLPRKYSICDTKHRLGNIDVLCLQEVKVFGFILNSTCHMIWPDGVSFSSQHEASQGGVVTLLSPRLSPLVISHGYDPMQRVVWILLSSQNHSFDIVDIYASNDVIEHSHLWRWLADSLPPATYLFYMDFNMVELAIDKVGLLPFQWLASE